MRFVVEKQFFVMLLLSVIILKVRTALNRFKYPDFDDYNSVKEQISKELI